MIRNWTIMLLLGLCTIACSEDDPLVSERMTTICDITGNFDRPWEIKLIPESELGIYLADGALQPGNVIEGKPQGTLINNLCEEVYLETVDFDNGIIYVHPIDNCGESGLPWSITYNITGATSVVDGVTNQQKIMLDQTGEQDPFAAKVCEELEALGFDDWYLPSRGELNALYEQLYLNQIGSFSERIYWTSTEATFEDTEDHQWDGWTQVFESGKQKLGFKNISVSCRCIRK